MSGLSLLHKMNEARQIPMDPAEIALWKRLTLIALRFLLASTIPIVIILQSHWLWFYLVLPQWDLCMTGSRSGVTFSITPLSTMRTGPWYKRKPSPDAYALWPVVSSGKTRMVPGIHYSDRFRGDGSRYLFIHHTWIITFAAVVYFFASWRIRRTAGMQSASP